MTEIKNELHLADCLDLLKNWHSNGKTNWIDLIYIDPPFNSNRNYNVLFDTKMTEEAFIDTWSSISYLDELEGISSISPVFFNILNMLEETGLPKSYISYLVSMSIRCWYMREMLKDSGSLYFHCDPTMSHYVKIMLDCIFGNGNFVNEIIWCYKTGGVATTNFPKKHDILFLYTKTNTFTFNPQRELKTSDEMTRAIELHPEEFFDDNDGKGRYTWYHRPGHNVKFPNGVKQYVEAYVRDYWNIPALTNMATERIGYPTQKPEELIERVIKASSNENDMVADFFMGGGTTINVADKLKRNYIGVDINSRSLQLTQERFEKRNKIPKRDFIIYGIPNSSKELLQLVNDNILGPNKNSKFAFEDVIVKYYLPSGVVGNIKQVGDGSIDARFYFKFKSVTRPGIIQITSSLTGNINHLKAFCCEVAKGTGEIGIYIAPKKGVTNGMYREAKTHGKMDIVDKVQILTIEELIDEGKLYSLPQDLMTI